MSVTKTGPATVTAGTNATYTITLTNNGPNAAQGVVLTDLLPAGSTFVSMTQTAGTDGFTYRDWMACAVRIQGEEQRVGIAEHVDSIVVRDAAGGKAERAASVGGNRKRSRRDRGVGV